MTAGTDVRGASVAPDLACLRLAAGTMRQPRLRVRRLAAGGS